MGEKRRAPRLKEKNKVAITVISNKKNIPKEKIIGDFSKDISLSGAKIQTDIPLHVGNLLMLDFTVETLQQKIIAVGKVKWVKIIVEGASYEVGVEFVNTPIYAIQKLKDYISSKVIK